MNTSIAFFEKIIEPRLSLKFLTQINRSYSKGCLTAETPQLSRVFFSAFALRLCVSAVFTP
jgi:hypothetical protein